MRLLTDAAFLSRTVGEIYDCALDPGRWRVLLPQLGALIGARRVAMGVVDQAGGAQAGHPVLEGYPDLDRLARYAAVNPVLPLALTWPLDRSVVVSRDLDRQALRRTRYWREYLAPQGDADAIAFVATREGDLVGNWLLVTQEDRPPITEEEAAGFELIAPHMRRAIEIGRLFGAQRVAAETHRAALGALDVPVLIMDGGRRLLFANPRGEAALAEGDLLRPREGRLAGATDDAEAALRRISAEALAGGAGGFEAEVAAADGTGRLVFAVALDTGAGQRSILLALRGPREATRNPVAVAARMFGLTPAQVQVLAFVAQGHPPDAVAAILGISVTTVRSHLGALFARTGTRRQAELVARTLALASPLRIDGKP